MNALVRTFSGIEVDADEGGALILDLEHHRH